MRDTELDAMTDDQVLAAAGDAGPAIIGEALFARAQAIRVQNPTGALGPAITGSGPAPVDEEADEGEADDEDAPPTVKSKPKAKAARRGRG